MNYNSSMEQKYKDMLKGAALSKALSSSKSSSSDPVWELLVLIFIFCFLGISSFLTVNWLYHTTNLGYGIDWRFLGLWIVFFFGYMVIILAIDKKFPNFFSRLGLVASIVAVVGGLIWMIFLS